jgi:hypothetical protein
MKILAFDIGIRNLAWCLMSVEGVKKVSLVGWQNYDLLAGAGHEAPKEKIACERCSIKAAFQNTAGGAGAVASKTCLRHCPAERPPLKDLSGGEVYRKLPALAILRAAAVAKGCLPKKATKVTILDALQAHYSLPIEKVKLKKAVEHELTMIHDSIRCFVQTNLAAFRQATHILLENQPVLKNPTMKSVQILLFATLRDLLQPGPPPLKLVHAGKKVMGKATGDAGYKSRKDASEAAVEEVLSAEVVGATRVVGSAEWLARFKAQAKKSDLADAFLMCLQKVESGWPAAVSTPVRSEAV